MEEQKWLTQEALNRAGFGGGSAGAVGSSVATSAGRRAGGRPSYEDQLGFYRQDPVPVGKAPLPSQEFIPLTQAPAQHSHLGNVPMMQEYNHRHQHQLPPPATLSGRSPHEEQSYWPPTSGSEYEVPPPHGFHTYASGPYNNHHHHHHQQQQQQQQQQYDQFHPAQDLRAPASIASPAPALAPMVTVGSESPAQGLMAVASPQPTNRDYYQRMQSLELPRLPLPPTITAPGTQQ
ncbi:hypothetical protein BGZ54_010292 [Gamsiella multidivaricata]|nr:hypothetical protein BGZ54_010292 [Gamsiella multidivaricata]